MALDWDTLLERADRRLHSSAIRDLLAVTAQPQVISFAGGLPAPELFPVEAMRASYDAVFGSDGAAALQYGPTEGHRPLREYLAERLARRGIRVEVDQILITSGSQQALDLIGKALVSHGDPMVVESPSYVGAVQAFAAREPRFIAAEMDDRGLVVDRLAERLEREMGSEAARKPTMLYSIASFQNPSGVTMSRPRREALLALLSHHGIPLVEDDPYGELRYEGLDVPPIRSLPGGEETVYLGTFSKILAPGLRLGWVVAPTPLIRRLALAKQGADLHTDGLAQRAILHYCTHNDLDASIARMRELYTVRRDAMLRSLGEHLPAETRWTHPEGGLFIWVTLPDGLDSRALLRDALARGVAFVPGAAFHVDGSGARCMRLSFSVAEPARIEEGVRRLGEVVAEHSARATSTVIAAARSR